MRTITYGAAGIVLLLLLATSCQSIFDDETGITPQKLEEVESAPIICCFHPWTMPSYPGGQSALLRFLAENLTWPESLKESTVEGMMVVQFAVECDGSITEPKIVRSIHPDFDPVCLELVNKMPKWIPGSWRGQPTRVQMNLPIRIKLE